MAVHPHLAERVHLLAATTAPTLQAVLSLRSLVEETLYDDRAATCGLGPDGPTQVYELLAELVSAWSAPTTDQTVAMAMLPLPGQFDHLVLLEQERHPAIAGFLQAEASIIAEKLTRKTRKGVKLRHCMQVLRAPGQHEPGILRVFALPYALAVQGLAARLGERFIVYAEPSMGLVFRHAWWRCMKTTPLPSLVGCCGPEDRAFLRSQGVSVTRLAHSDYMPPLAPLPMPAGPPVDILMNATFEEMERKRHGLLLKLLASPTLAHARALVMGRGEPDDVARFQQMAREAGVAERVEVVANIPRHEVDAHVVRARLCVHLSLNENGPRALFECFRAGVPVVASRCMNGIDPSVFTAETGELLAEDQLEAGIANALDRAHTYDPAAWFARESGSAVNSARLNTELRELCEGRSIPWHTDICALSASGANRHADPNDYQRLLPVYREVAHIVNHSGALPVTVEVE